MPPFRPSLSSSLTQATPKQPPVLSHQQSRSVATTRRFTKANRNAPAASATPGSKYLPSMTSSSSFPTSSSTPTPTPQSTIIFHPPPSAPSPYSTPPLFLPPSDPRRSLLQQAHQFANPYSTGTRALPPPVRPPPQYPEKRYHLGEKEISEMRRLRKKDAWEWTIPKLAEKFQCSKVFVGIAAPASQERREWGEALHQRFRDRWGQKKQKAVMERGKRRELWEKDA